MLIPPNIKLYCLINGLFFINIMAYQGQEKISPVYLKKANKKSTIASSEVYLIKGDLQKIKSGLKAYNVDVLAQYLDYLSVRIHHQDVEAVSQIKGLSRMILQVDHPFVLNDTLRINNRVKNVHTRTHPLAKSYTGKDVVIGIIDLGLEVRHPDFLNNDSTTRVLYYWNQNSNAGTAPLDYGYGTQWNANQINAGDLLHTSTSDHGTHVTGIACSNGNAPGNYKGMAPESDIIFVDYYQGNQRDWKLCVVQAIEYIFTKAEEQGKPCVVNLSLGSYIGSHDGQDPYTQMVDSMIDAAPSRAVVCAAGNSGGAHPFHLSYEVTSDTAFTWFRYNPLTWYGFSGLMFELWADTAEFNQVKFSIGADKISPALSYKGATDFRSVVLGDYFDTIYNAQGDFLFEVGTWTELIDEKYFMQVYVFNPDSTDYHFRFSTTGSGRFDVWSSEDYTGSSQMLSDSNFNFNVLGGYDGIAHYKKPDQLSSMVSGWACSDKVITVGNYTNRSSYVSYGDSVVSFPFTPGELFFNSSLGPTRDGRMKPDISAPGGVVLSATRFFSLAADTINNPRFISQEGYHKRNSGTSMAAPSVAGAAALYFESCSMANAHQLKQDLMASAYRDVYTGPQENNYYGHGKLDAFALLQEPFIGADLTLQANNTTICASQTELIQASDQFNAYLWNSGELSSSIQPTTSNYYLCNVSNAQGCTMQTDSLLFVVHQNPPQPQIDLQNSLLVSSIGYQYQWYKNDQPILSENNQTLLSVDTGYYSVEVINPNGCSAFSEPFLVTQQILTDRSLEQFTNTQVFTDRNTQSIQIISKQAFARYSLFNLTGQSIQSGHLHRPSQIILNKISSGLYFLELETKENQKIIKQFIWP